MRFLPLSFVSLSLSTAAFAGTLNKGEACNNDNSRLQDGTYQFWSECNSVTYCNQGVCTPKGCRSDDFPFGYAQGADLPPKCGPGEFCPDEGSQCLPLLAVGSQCQLNRDDQCQPPQNFKELADESGRGLNFNGSVCLGNICMFADATLGTACTVENVPYIAYSLEGEFIDIVSRGNCKLGLYCDTATKLCMNNKVLGETCSGDKECDSWNCLSTGVCGIAAATPRHFGVWVYILVGLGIVGGMAATLTGLYFAHRKQRDLIREKRAQYWREQNAFHQNLMQMRETARAFIMTLPGNKEYARDMSDDSQVSMLHSTPPKGSGLRHYLADDGSSDFDDSLMMQSGRPLKAEGRF